MVYFFKLRALFALLCLFEYARSARNHSTAFQVSWVSSKYPFCFLAGPLPPGAGQLPASFGLCPPWLSRGHQLHHCTEKTNETLEKTDLSYKWTQLIFSSFVRHPRTKSRTESQFFADSGQKIKFPEAWQERKEEISHREASWTNLRNVMEYGMNVSRDFNEWSDRLWDLRDKRVDGWFMLDSFWPTLLLVAAYLFIVKIWGPRFMENRPAYNINTFLIYYNACQVGLSAYIFVQVITWFLANLRKNVNKNLSTYVLSWVLSLVLWKFWSWK